MSHQQGKKVSFKYPRRVFIRRSLRLLIRFLVRLFARLEIKGRENFPGSGPLILAGNHVGVLEAVLLAGFAPQIVEFLGTGDVPFDPNYAIIPNLYGLIPVNRGNLDRDAINNCLEVLSQDGWLGVFPEGGIWNPSQMSAQTGIALLSYKAKAPILPIGFGGMRGALGQVLRLKRPRILMNVGKLMESVTLMNGEVIKEGLQRAAAQTLNAIAQLLPGEEFHAHQAKREIKYLLRIEVSSGEDDLDQQVTSLVAHGSALARLLYTPVLLDTLLRNLKLPIRPLNQLSPVPDLAAFQQALRAVLNYLQVNPGFFTYRFGIDEGLAVQEALRELDVLADQAIQNGFILTITPIQQVTDQVTSITVRNEGGDFPPSMC